ncbi:DUF2254 domain-containing protein (plasmid) [Photobacterium sp. GJ3]|uniref:DUF2254 domain-containing protein n=1 Tax=Photobacterium sp. GJ3 TaxID=2829502 RepID=UPI001B8ADA11|nr:DUF2254 domain-containing protein [Photobacterium sp. GJ3]QUJ70101.1 DUF2254 domain-containing protein [Photobacterium sp. GJ3]
MKTYWMNRWETIRNSFWFVPAMLVLIAVGLVRIVVTLDRHLHQFPVSLPEIGFAGGAEGARSILSTIAGSMVTVAGVAFSITIVALTLASSQFGPRLLRNFMRDPGNQYVLGTFIATFIYCLLVLSSVTGQNGQIFVPRIAVNLSLLLALMNVGVLIYFIHHVATSIQADNVVNGVYEELNQHIEHFFPESLGAAVETPQKVHLQRTGMFHRTVPAAAEGYLQAVDRACLQQLAASSDCQIQLRYRAGAFVVKGSSLAVVSSEKALEETLDDQLQSCFIVGKMRTPEQDPEFAIHQLVEVAVRALSPGINDPYTAMTCVDRLSAILCTLTGRAFHPAKWYDDMGTLQLEEPALTFSGVLAASFDQIRQHSLTDVAVSIRLLEGLARIASHCRTQAQQQAVSSQAEMIYRSRQNSLPVEEDRADMTQRYQAVQDELRQL